MPALRRHYTDEQLLALVEAQTYRIMTEHEMVHMLLVLFPHMNIQDKEAFLRDIRVAEPQKFATIWRACCFWGEGKEGGGERGGEAQQSQTPLLDASEAAVLAERLGVSIS